MPCTLPLLAMAQPRPPRPPPNRSEPGPAERRSGAAAAPSRQTYDSISKQAKPGNHRTAPD
jgi:hypothetical protein